MPTVKPGESKNDFVKRCIPVVLHEGTAKDGSQAAAICHSMYRKAIGMDFNFVLSLGDPGELDVVKSRKDPLSFWKQIAYEGTFRKNSQRIDITPELMDHWCNTFAEMSGEGIQVPVPLEHTKDPEKRRGTVTALRRQRDSRGRQALYAKFKFRDEEAAKLALTAGASIFVPISAPSASGKVYKKPIEHVAITDYPVISDLEPFEAVALSWDESEHPRHEKGDERGGEFAPKGGGPKVGDKVVFKGDPEARGTIQEIDDNDGEPHALVKLESGLTEWAALEEIKSLRRGKSSSKNPFKGQKLTRAERGRYHYTVRNDAGEFVALVGVMGGGIQTVTNRHGRLLGKVLGNVKYVLKSLSEDNWALDSEKAGAKAPDRIRALLDDMKLAWNEEEHPRHEKGDERGGEFAPKGRSDLAEPKMAARLAAGPVKPEHWEDAQRELQGVVRFDTEARHPPREFFLLGSFKGVKTALESNGWNHIHTSKHDTGSVTSFYDKGTRRLKLTQQENEDGTGHEIRGVLGKRPKTSETSLAWNEDLHPREDAGDERGGQFTSKGSAGRGHERPKPKLTNDEANTLAAERADKRTWTQQELKSRIEKLRKKFPLLKKGKSHVHIANELAHGRNLTNAEHNALRKAVKEFLRAERDRLDLSEFQSPEETLRNPVNFAWDESAHPREDAGSEKGGQFAPKGGSWHVKDAEKDANGLVKVPKDVAAEGAKLAMDAHYADIRWNAAMDKQIDAKMSRLKRDKKRLPELNAIEEREHAEVGRLQKESVAFEKETGLNPVEAYEAHNGKRWPHYKVDSYGESQKPARFTTTDPVGRQPKAAPSDDVHDLSTRKKQDYAHARDVMKSIGLKTAKAAYGKAKVLAGVNVEKALTKAGFEKVNAPNEDNIYKKGGVYVAIHEGIQGRTFVSTYEGQVNMTDTRQFPADMSRVRRPYPTSGYSISMSRNSSHIRVEDEDVTLKDLATQAGVDPNQPDEQIIMALSKKFTELKGPGQTGAAPQNPAFRPGMPAMPGMYPQMAAAPRPFGMSNDDEDEDETQAVALSGSLLDMAKDRRAMKIDKLLEEGYITPATKKEMVAEYLKDEVIAFSHMPDFDDGFERTIKLIVSNGRVMPRGKTGPQAVVALSKASVDGGEPRDYLAERVEAMRKERASAN